MMTLEQKTKTGFQEAVLKTPLPSDKGPSWLSAVRALALERFKSVGFPTRQHESWKYLSLQRLLEQSFNLEAQDALQITSITPKSAQVITGALGKAVPTIPAVEQEVWIKSIEAEQNPFALMNAIYFQEGIYLRIPQQTVITEPISYTFSATSQANGAAIHPRLVVLIEKNASAAIVLDHGAAPSGTSGTYFMNTVLQIILQDHAKLNLIVRERAADSAYQFLNIRTQLAKGSELQCTSVTYSGGVIREEVVANLIGNEAHCEFNGLSVLAHEAQVFHHLTMNHQANHTSSAQTFKNILADKAQAEFNSLVHVYREGAKSSSEQLNRNLLLSEEARAYSRPQLKIDTDDVRCSHGSATGQLDDREIFYLRSRGLSEKEARKAMTQGFAGEMLEDLKPENLRLELEKEIQTQIENFLS